MNSFSVIKKTLSVMKYLKYSNYIVKEYFDLLSSPGILILYTPYKYTIIFKFSLILIGFIYLFS
jgi:hypothetical protein